MAEGARRSSQEAIPVINIWPQIDAALMLHNMLHHVVGSFLAVQR